MGWRLEGQSSSRGREGGKRTEVVRQDRVSHRDVACDAFVEATLGENTECRCEVLFAVEALFLEGGELGVLADLEEFAGFGAAAGLDLGWGGGCTGGGGGGVDGLGGDGELGLGGWGEVGDGWCHNGWVVDTGSV